MSQVLGLICLVSSIPCSCQGLLSSFINAEHWKGTASGLAGLF